MPNDLDPRVNQWYQHRDKGQRFYITAIDDESDTVEVQHFDGDVEEFTFEEWDDLDVALSDPPANWIGPQDDEDRDPGGDVTDTEEGDWERRFDEQPDADDRRPSH